MGGLSAIPINSIMAYAELAAMSESERQTLFVIISKVDAHFLRVSSEKTKAKAAKVK